MYKDHLGDTVYIEDDHGRYVLTTEDGTGITNTFYIDDYMIEKMFAFISRARLRREGIE